MKLDLTSPEYGDQEGCSYFNVDIAEHVATVTMSRLPVNAQNAAFRRTCIRIFDHLGDREDVRAIILTGAGKTFSAGADLKSRPSGENPGGYADHNRTVRDSFNALLECDKPIIAAINGPALGAGFALASVCDIIIIAETAWISMPEASVGLAGGVRFLLRHFSQSDARLIMFTAAKITGPELYRMGVASACVPADQLLSRAREIAGQIARNSPMAVRALKTSFRVTEGMPIHEGYRYEQSHTVALARSTDAEEIRRATAAGEKPVFGRQSGS